ncbi:HPF/RaiA family ribosome-associated protein [Candidatus Giovannonibacteria bacterium]|nr:HPF/RaiA family ribosome-associated protein [Candidatus Giovannonibacteria bacterium]
MQLRIKTTGFTLTPSLEELARQKLLYPLERRISRETPADFPLDVELAKTTRHHEEGKVWKCEINLSLPHVQNTIFIEVIEESIEAAIDRAKDELERQVGEYKEKRASKFLRAARSLKDFSNVSRLARSAKGALRWFRRR